MKRSLIAGLALALAATIAVPTAVSAQSIDDATIEAGDPTVQGRGWLWARGNGRVDIDMRGTIRLDVEGDVRVIDHAGDMRVTIRGGSEDATERSGVALRDFDGRLRVHGSGFSVEVDGQVALRARGQGRAVLEGQGVYRTRRGDVTAWDGIVELGEPHVDPVGQ